LRWALTWERSVFRGMSTGFSGELREQSVFAPEATQAMSAAFEQICKAFNIPPEDTHDRDVIAARIIDLARNGLTEPSALRERILREGRVDV
jgi:hypothetical protein